MQKVRITGGRAVRPARPSDKPCASDSEVVSCSEVPRVPALSLTASPLVPRSIGECTSARTSSD